VASVRSLSVAGHEVLVDGRKPDGRGFAAGRFSIPIRKKMPEDLSAEFLRSASSNPGP
jgi:hypothetical protein